MIWVTRERPKIDRIACPWLILRFIDSQAQFRYVPADQVLGVATQTGAIPYDIPGVEPMSASFAASMPSSRSTNSTSQPWCSWPPSSAVPTRYGSTWPRNPQASMPFRSASPRR